MRSALVSVVSPRRVRWLVGWIVAGVVLYCAAMPRLAVADEAVADGAGDAIAAAAASKSAAELLPASTVFYAEVARPGELVDTLLGHPLRKRVESLDAYRAAVLSKQYLQFNFGLAVAEAAVGMKWDEAVKTLAGDGVFLGIDAGTQGGVVLVHATDAKKLAAVRDKLFAFVRSDARNKGKDDPIEEIEYRGVKAYKLGEGYAATLGPWLMLTNKTETGKLVIDRAADAKESTLAGKMEFLSARNSVGEHPTAWSYVDVATLRSAGLLAKVLGDKTDNLVVELLVGGLLSNLGNTPYATAALYIDDKQVRLVASAPHDPSWVAKPREFYFGPEGKGAAPIALRPDQTALSLVTHRDLGGVWLAAPDLLDEKGNAGLSQADSNLSTFFSGKEFGREILGAFEPELQIVLARQDYAKTGGGVPEIKLPSGAIVLRMKEPEKMQQKLKVAFQSIVGFLNIVGGQNGLPQLDQNTERRTDGLVVSAEYMMDDDAQRTNGKIYHNFSPTVAVVGDHFIIASTKQVAQMLVEAATHPASGSATNGDSPSVAAVNTALEVDAAVVHALLDDNRGQLVAQNMLEKGHEKAKAEAEIGTILDVVSWFERASLRLTTPSDRLELELAVRLADSASKP
ncbi:MAG: hypothetical protein WD875_15995 [Pirellulales bacterium]